MNKSSFNQSIKQSIHQTIHPSINQSNQSNRSNQSIGIQNYPFFILQNKRKTPQITALRLDTNKGIAYEGITQSPGTKLQVTTKPRWKWRPVADGKIFLEHFLIVGILCEKWLWQVVLLPLRIRRKKWSFCSCWNLWSLPDETYSCSKGTNTRLKFWDRDILLNVIANHQQWKMITKGSQKMPKDLLCNCTHDDSVARSCRMPASIPLDNLRS